MRVDTNCHVKLEKHTITSESIVSLANEPLYYDWSWDPLKMPAVTLKDPGHVAKVKEHLENATIIDDLFISTVILPKSKFSKFAMDNNNFYIMFYCGQNVCNI